MSERPLFRSHDAVTPFADGERFVWRGADREDEVVTYHREGLLYRLGPWVGSDLQTEMMFIDIPETPEQDFIAQMRFDPSDSHRLYAFYWRTDVGLRVLNSDSAFAEGGPGWETFVSVCGERALSGCQLVSVAELRRLYMEGVYPAFVAGTATPADYVDQITLAEAEQEKPEEQ